MIMSRILKNQILKIVKSQLGLNTDKYKFRKIENELRTLRGKVLRMEKIAHSRRNLVEREGKYYLEEENA
jgi:hypothetical protein